MLTFQAKPLSDEEFEQILNELTSSGYGTSETSTTEEQLKEAEDETQENEDQFARQHRSESELRSLFEDDEEQLEEDEVKSQHSEVRYPTLWKYEPSFQNALTFLDCYREEHGWSF